jgi:hypothetical protein
MFLFCFSKSSIRGFLSRKIGEFFDRKVENDTRNTELSSVLKHKLVDVIKSRFPVKRSIKDLSYAGLTHGEVFDLLDKNQSVKRLDADPDEDAPAIATGNFENNPPNR